MLHYVFSNNADSGTISNFKYTINLPSKHNRVSLVQCSIPKSFYIINDGYNTFSINSTQYTVTEGNYSVSTFTTAINTLISAFGSIALNEKTGKFVITSATASTLTIPEHSDLAPLFGFSDNVVKSFSDGSLTSDYVVNFGGVNEIYLTSSIVKDFSAGIFDDILHIIYPSQNVSFQTIQYVNPCVKDTGKDIAYGNSREIDIILKIPITFQLLDQDGVEIDLNGSNWSCVILTWEETELKTYNMLKAYINFKTNLEKENRIKSEN